MDWFCVKLGESTADCPRRIGGLSAGKTSGTTSFWEGSGTTFGIYGRLSAVESRTVRRCFWLGDTDCRLSVGIEVLYGGPSAAEGRTVRESRKMPRNSSAESRYYQSMEHPTQKFLRFGDNQLRTNKKILSKINGRIANAHTRFRINRDRIAEIDLLAPMSLLARNGDSIGLSQI